MESDWKEKALEKMKQHVSGGKSGAASSAKKKLGQNEKNAVAGKAGEQLGGISGAEETTKEKSQDSFLNNVSGKSKKGGGLSGKKKAKGKMSKKKAAIAIIIIILLLMFVMVFFLFWPFFLIGTMHNAGADMTTIPSETLSEAMTPQFEQALDAGKVSSSFVERLKSEDIVVGQVDVATGEFMETNVAIDRPDREIAAAKDDFEAKSGSGKLSVKYKGEVIDSSNFTEKMNSDPGFRGAFLNAAAINTNYYYGDDVTKVYSSMGITRSEFSNYKVTGDPEKDEENFLKIVEDMLNKKTDITISNDDQTVSSSKSSSEDIKENAQNFIKTTMEQTKDGDDVSATTKAATLLNTAISANEPYQNARAFMSIMTPVDQAMADGSGPISQVFNMLTKSVTTTSVDIETGEETTTNKSLIGSSGVGAIINKKGVPGTDNYSRDRITKSTEKKNSQVNAGNSNVNETIKKTMYSSESSLHKNSTGTKNNGETNPNIDSMGIGTSEAVAKVAYEKVSESAQGENGGHAFAAGGSFIGNKIAQHALGAMPSDEGTTLAYYDFVDKVIAKNAKSDRARLSPFDISSPYTFLGSIVSQMSKMATINSSSTTVPVNMISSTANLARNSVASLVQPASAESKTGNQYYTTFGNCSTLETVGAVGDGYCNEIVTAAIKYIDKPLSWFEEQLGSDNIEDGGIKKRSKLEEFQALFVERDAPFGVTDVAVCESYGKMEDEKLGFLGKIAKIFTQLGSDMTKKCSEVDEYRNKATGAEAVLSSSKEDMILYAGYTMAVQANKIIGNFRTNANDETSDAPIDPITAFKMEYYKEHPIDNSPAGYIARISGMSKEDAQLAINYASYLNYVAMYDPSEKYDFTHSEPVQNPLEKLDFSDEVIAQYIKPELVVYDSIRYRNFAV